jgi:hypothetical protein
MSPCLQPEEIVDLVEGRLPEARMAHAADCPACRAAAADLAAAWVDARAADVPEPPPYFWTSINRRVQSAIGEQPSSGWAAWLGWETVVPLAGMAAILIALGAAIARPPAPAVEPPIAASVPEEVAADAAGEPIDDALALVVDLADSLPDGDGEALALQPLPDLGEVAAAALTDDELHALEQLLREAVDRPKS